MKVRNKIFVCLIAVGLCMAAAFALNDMNEPCEETALTPMPTEEPTPTPRPLPDYAAMEAELSKRLGEQQGDWSLYFELYDTGDVISINSHQVYSASLIKLFVAEYAYSRMYEGGMADSQHNEDLIYKMLSYSDNDSWEELARLLGGGSYSAGMQDVTNYAQHAGFGDTGTFYKGPHKNFNFTSVNDVGTYLRLLLNGEIVSREYSQRILDKLKNQAHRQKLPSGVPEGVETANKTGELEYQQGDAMIVYSPNAVYILVVIGDSLDNSYGTIPFFGEISEIVFNYVNKE